MFYPKVPTRKREKKVWNLLVSLKLCDWKLIMQKESTNAKCAKFWRERMQRRSLRNLAIVSVTVVTLT